MRKLNVRPETDGRAVIPAEVLGPIGTDIDGAVYVACLVEEDGGGPEVFVSPLEVRELTSNQLYENGTQLVAPEEPLGGVGIQPDGDPEAVFEGRRITILPAWTGGIIPREILELCSEIGINPEKVRIIMEMEGLDGRSEKDVPNRGR